MNTTMTVQLPTDTLLKLIEKLRRRGGSQDLSEAMTKAIEFWLEDPAKFVPGTDPEGLHGYQWKTLFLPEGTAPAPIAAAPMPAALPAPPSTATPPRNTDSAPGWELPERRKFRYRLEDVAY